VNFRVFLLCLLISTPVALVVTSRVSAQATESKSSKWISRLPEDKAKNIIVTKCQECHTLERIVTSRRTRDGWSAIVNLMIELGASVSSDEVPIVTDYLSTNFGPLGVSNSSSPLPGDTANVTQSSKGSATVLDLDHVQFSPGPDWIGSDGTLMAVFFGDPAKTGFFSLLLKIPAGHVIPPHSFSGDEHLICLVGKFEFGEGKTFEVEKLHSVEPGMIVQIPAQVSYFGRAKEAAVVLVYGNGPYQ